MFQDILYPPIDSSSQGEAESLCLRQILRYTPPPSLKLADAPLAVFDFETTGLDANGDRIIEIGALKFSAFGAAEQFSTLVKPDVELSKASSAISGITKDMLEGQPTIDQVLPGFLKFIEGCILVAHNAEFDMSFLRAACSRLGYDLEWPCFCTLKMARVLLPSLESKNLDTLAKHYGLTFEARHRSIGDAKVTTAVLKALCAGEGKHLTEWRHMQDFTAG